ncbi:uncharacterized protein LOC144078686 isoform X5 [Stigmatopora argus]
MNEQRYPSTQSHCENSPFEAKYLRCSNLNMPLLATDFFKSELQVYLDGLTAEMWDLIEYGHFDCNAFMVLLKMWQSILYKISQEVLSVVLPQVEELAQILISYRETTVGTFTRCLPSGLRIQQIHPELPPRNVAPYVFHPAGYIRTAPHLRLLPG